MPDEKAASWDTKSPSDFLMKCQRKTLFSLAEKQDKIRAADANLQKEREKEKNKVERGVRISTEREIDRRSKKRSNETEK